MAAAGIGPYFARIMRSAAHDVQREVMRRRRETDFGDDDGALIEHGTELDDGNLARMKALLALCLDALPPHQRPRYLGCAPWSDRTPRWCRSWRSPRTIPASCSIRPAARWSAASRTAARRVLARPGHDSAA